MAESDSESDGSTTIREKHGPLDYATWFLTIGFTAAGLGVRIWMAVRSGIYRDEGQFLWIVRLRSWSQMINFLRYHESHPPLFYMLMRVYLGFAGDSERSATALPIFFGVILIPTMYFVGSRMFSRRVGLTASLLTAFAPTLVDYSTWIRPYSLLPWLCLSSVYFLWKLFLDRRFSSGFFYVSFTLAMLLTHNWSFIVLAGEWTVVLTWFVSLRIGKRDWRQDAWIWIVVQVVIAVFYSPWLPTLIGQIHGAGYGRPITAYKPVEFFARSFLSATLLDIGLFTYSLVLLIVGVAVVHSVVRFRVASTTNDSSESTDRFAQYLVLGVPSATLIAAVILNRYSTLLFIYCISIVGPCLLLWFVNLLDKSFQGRLIIPKYVILALVLIQYGRHDIAMGRDIIKSDDREAAAAVIAAGALPVDLILVQPQWNASSFFYYYPFYSHRLDYPIKHFLGPVYYNREIIEMLADESKFDRFLEEIDRAHDDRKKIWLVFENINLPGIESSDEIISTRTIQEGFPKLYSIRSRQIYRKLSRLYGKPKLIYQSKNRSHQGTHESVFLFDVSIDSDRSSS